jgi:hypothetical protein
MATETEFEKRKREILNEAIRQRNELSPPNAYRTPETKMVIDAIFADAYEQIRKLERKYNRPVKRNGDHSQLPRPQRETWLRLLHDGIGRGGW